ncbi:cytosine permease [Clostridia bacterium]|nr:cytosine permease [Clostridia bacterium]
MNKVRKRYEINNYPLSPIPQEARSKWMGLSIIWAGFILTVSNFLTGTLISEGLTLSSSFGAIVLGNSLLFLVAMVMGFIAQETGLSATYLSRYAFGIRGSKIISLLFSLSFICWSAIGIGLAAKSLGHYTGWNVVFLSLVMTVLFGLTAVYGFPGMVRISSISVPIVVLISYFGIRQILAVGEIELSTLMLLKPTETMQYGRAVSIVVGSWIVGAVAAPDILRFALRKRDVLITMLLTFVLLNSLQTGIGAIMGLVVGSPDLPDILFHLGFGLFGSLLLIFLSWTTADNNLYASGLGIANFLDRGERIKTTTVSIVLAGVLAVGGMYNYLGQFLALVSLVFAPIGGVIIVDFYLHRAGLIQHALYYQGIRWRGIISVLAGILIGLYIESPMPFATAFLTAGLIYLLICVAKIYLSKSQKEISE